MCLWFENRCLNVFSVSPKYSFVLLLSGVTCALYITLVDRQLSLRGHCLRSLQLQDLSDACARDIRTALSGLSQYLLCLSYNCNLV